MTTASSAALAGWLHELQEASFENAQPATRSAYPAPRRLSGDQLAAFLTGHTYALASTTRTDGRAHAAPTLFTCAEEAFWLPTLGSAVRVRNVRAHPWVALSVLEGEHETHAAVLTEGPAEVLAAAPEPVRQQTQQRNRGGSLEWATAWIRITPHRLLSFAEHAWAGATSTGATS